MDKLLLVDGSNLLFQMFFGMPARIVNEDGRAIQGTLGFVGALLKIIRMVRPTHVAVLFDGEHRNPRCALDENYKANRPDIPEEESPFSQIGDVCAALDYLKIRRAETTECEADDWIAGYVRRYRDTNEIVIASMDSDFFQLIGDSVFVLRYRGKSSTICDSTYIKERFGILPEQYAAFKSLVGDPADNIPGIPGVGVKTAASLLNRFGTLSELLRGTGEIGRLLVRAAVEENRERLGINYRLIALSGSDTLPFAKEDMAWTDAGLTTMQVLHGIGLRRGAEQEKEDGSKPGQ